MTRNVDVDVDVVEIDRGTVSKLDTTGINGNVVVRGRAAAITVMIWNHFHVHIRNKYDSSFQIIIFIGVWYTVVGCWMLDGVWAVLLLLLLLLLLLGYWDTVVCGGWCGFGSLVSSDSYDVLGTPFNLTQK